MTERDIKLLWGNAGNKCSMPGCRKRLTIHGPDAAVIGEMAHIVGEKPGASRFNDDFSESERDGYGNRILLCPTCHTEIDKTRPEYWTVARLHAIKAEHEAWAAHGPEQLPIAKEIRASGPGSVGRAVVLGPGAEDEEIIVNGPGIGERIEVSGGATGEVIVSKGGKGKRIVMNGSGPMTGLRIDMTGPGTGMHIHVG